MKVARSKGVETIINPAPATPLPEDAYQGLGHLIVNETEAAILSGIENPTNWDEVAAVFVARGVKNIIITLGGEVRPIVSCSPALSLTNYSGSILPDGQTAGAIPAWPSRASKKGQSRRHNSRGRHFRRRIHGGCCSLGNHVAGCGFRPRCSD